MKRIICLFVLLLCLTSCSEKPDLTEKEPVKEKEPTVFTFDTSYVYRGSSDPIMPRISLDIVNNRYSFSYSGFSSFLPMGLFEIIDEKLYLWADADKTEAYVFDVTDEGYVFKAEDSVAIPTYRVSGYSDERYTPVPDGALFEPAAEEGESPVALTKGWVQRRGELVLHDFSDVDLKAVADIIEGKEWTEGLPDCAYDCQLNVSGLFMGYHSDCGTLNMVEPSYVSREEPCGKSLTLSDDEKLRLNDVLKKYITLGSDVVEIG